MLKIGTFFKVSLFLCLLIFSEKTLHGQEKLDSLQDVIQKSKSDSVKVQAILELAKALSKEDVQQSFQEYQRALKLSKKINYYQGIALASKGVGNNHYFSGDYVEALFYWEQAKNNFEKSNDFGGVSNVLSNMGAIYYNQSDYTRAIELYVNSLRLAEETSDSMRMGTVLQNIGAIHAETNEDSLAVIAYNRALNIFKSMNYGRGIGLANMNLGQIYRDTKLRNSKRSLNYFEKAIPYLKNTSHYSTLLRSIGRVKTEYLGLEEGFSYLDSALNLALTSKDSFEIARAYNSLASAYLDVNQNSKAITFFEKAKIMLKGSDRANYELLIATEGLKELYAKNNDYEKAFQNLALFQAINDSIQRDEANKKINSLLFNYEIQKKEDEINHMIALKDAELAAETAQKKQYQLEVSQKRLQQYFLFGGLAITLLFIGFIFNRFRVTRNQKNIIEAQKEDVDNAYTKLEEKSNEVTSSITYAKRIQSAILPSLESIHNYLGDSFVIYKPKDIVAGDFYWLEPIGEKVLFAVADCTGHGVPGALVSVVCHNALNRSLRENNLNDPGEILNKCREIVVNEFEKSQEEVNDGMDIALCALEGNHLRYAGANNSIWIIRENSDSIEEIKANKQPIGRSFKPQPFITHSVYLNKGDSFYIFSDGYVDQFGGDRGKKFKSVNLKKLLLSVKDKSMVDQKRTINDQFENWKGELEQVDDVCIIGVRFD